MAVLACQTRLSLQNSMFMLKLSLSLSKNLKQVLHDPLNHLQTVKNFEQLKILADARRMTILRMLMARPATLSQLGESTGEHPARVRHHLKKLESAGLVELVETRVVRGFVEKYYRAIAGAFLLQEVILPASSKPSTVVASGSHDLALELLARHLPEVEMITIPVGSMDGLVALRQGSAQLAGCHLLDAQSGKYNLPFVKRFFPDRAVSLVTLAHREQGLLVAPGNPLEIYKVEDLVRPGIRYSNRIPGSGTRLWMDQQLTKLGIPGEEIRGYEKEFRTHTTIAERITSGKADTGLGLLAAARLADLDFIPLFHERYDLVVPDEYLNDPQFAPFFEQIQSGEFRRLIRQLEGYETTNTGEMIPV